MVGTPALPLKGARVQSLVEEVVRCSKKKTNQKLWTLEFCRLISFFREKYKTAVKGYGSGKKKSSWARIPEAEHRPRSLRPHGEQHLPPFRKKTNCMGDPSTTPQMSLLPSREAERYSHKINNCLQILPLALMV